MRLAALLLAVGLLGPGVASACGIETDCMLGDRRYRIAMPENPDGPVGAFIFAHGYRGSARNEIRNKRLRAFAHDRGMAMVAPDASGDDWDIQRFPGNGKEMGARELAYFDALIDDLRDRHGIDTDRLVMSGFSAGGMLVWNLACWRGDRFAAFIPVAGTFWDPIPENCESGPVPLVHIHGTSDRIVPIEGRRIGRMYQGDVNEAMAMAGSSGGHAPAGGRSAGDLTCTEAENGDGVLLALCLHPGGHTIRRAYLALAWEMLQERGALP